jgi:hypothetical protein
VLRYLRSPAAHAPGGEAGHGGQGSELRIPAAVATLLGGVVNAWLFLLRVTS